MKKLLLYIVLCTIAFNLYSQESYTSFGVRGAIGISQLRGMKPYESAGIIPGSYFTTTGAYQSGVLPTWDIGYSVQKGKNNFVLQVDYLVTYINTGLKNAYIGESEKIKRITGFYTNLAFNFGVKWAIKDDYRLIFGLGPYVGMDIMGLIAGTDRSYGKDKKPSSGVYDEELKTDDANYKYFDWGGSILLGIEHNNYQFALNYHHGLYNIVYDQYPLYNRTLKLIVTYFF